ncbi:hypothetical protein PanWU01x14_347030 [Parasponia andersonii]|uniref:Uncharacterized protein n=1 Tax=Parasponia andersonii TaxID=3476 RepID=A0A2P5AC50_PARAD|nr:hypothetical protein PanWU01x14_347030 [Parasponia andersonii]
MPVSFMGLPNFQCYPPERLKSRFLHTDMPIRWKFFMIYRNLVLLFCFHRQDRQQALGRLSSYFQYFPHVGSSAAKMVCSACALTWKWSQLAEQKSMLGMDLRTCSLSTSRETLAYPPILRQTIADKVESTIACCLPGFSSQLEEEGQGIRGSSFRLW